MAYQILMDSCGDRTVDMKRDDRISLVPLRLQIDDREYIDDGGLDIRKLLLSIEQSTDIPRSSCPSPMEYQQKIDWGSERIYLISISGELSGSYNSASLAVKQISQTKADICLINSRSASAGQTLLALFIQDWERQGSSFHEITKKIAERKEKMKTRFVLEDLTMLERNGRLTGFKAKLAGALHICPVLAATQEGTICQTGQVRGMNRGIAKLFHQVVEDDKEYMWERMVISHCCNEEMAIELKTKLKKEFPERMIQIASTGGISSLYAGRGGIIVAYA